MKNGTHPCERLQEPGQGQAVLGFGLLLVRGLGTGDLQRLDKSMSAAHLEVRVHSPLPTLLPRPEKIMSSRAQSIQFVADLGIERLANEDAGAARVRTSQAVPGAAKFGVFLAEQGHGGCLRMVTG